MLAARCAEGLGGEEGIGKGRQRHGQDAALAVIPRGPYVLARARQEGGA